jgi:hypothetical protein
MPDYLPNSPASRIPTSRMAETPSIQAQETAAFDLERNCSSKPFCEFAEEKGGPLAALFYFAAPLTKSRFSVPVLHCEFAGSRTHDMLAALEGFHRSSVSVVMITGALLDRGLRFILRQTPLRLKVVHATCCTTSCLPPISQALLILARNSVLTTRHMKFWEFRPMDPGMFKVLEVKNHIGD